MNLPTFSLSDIYNADRVDIDLPAWDQTPGLLEVPEVPEGFGSEDPEPRLTTLEDILLPTQLARLTPLVAAEAVAAPSTRQLMDLERQVFLDSLSRNPLRSLRHRLGAESIETAVHRRKSLPTSSGPLAGYLFLDNVMDLAEAEEANDLRAWQDARSDLLGGLALLGGVDFLGALDDSAAQIRALPARVPYQGLKAIPSSLRSAAHGALRRPLASAGTLGLAYLIAEGLKPEENP